MAITAPHLVHSPLKEGILTGVGHSSLEGQKSRSYLLTLTPNPRKWNRSEYTIECLPIRNAIRDRDQLMGSTPFSSFFWSFIRAIIILGHSSFVEPERTRWSRVLAPAPKGVRGHVCRTWTAWNVKRWSQPSLLLNLNFKAMSVSNVILFVISVLTQVLYRPRQVYPSIT